MAGRYTRHARTIEEADMFDKVNSHISELQFMRESRMVETKDMTDPKDIANVEKKKKRHITSYNTYKWNVNGDIWIVTTEVYKDKAETVYNLYKKKQK